MLVISYIAVDGRGCGKVDNFETSSLPRSKSVRPGVLASLALYLACGYVESVSAFPDIYGCCVSDGVNSQREHAVADGASMDPGKNPRMDVARVDTDKTPCLAQCESVSDPRHRGCDL